MKTILKNIDYLVTMNEKRDELEDAFVVVQDGVITDVGTGTPSPGDIEIDLSGRIILPGFVKRKSHRRNCLTGLSSFMSGGRTSIMKRYT